MTSSENAEVEELQLAIQELERQLAATHRIAAGLSSITKVKELVQQALDISLELTDAAAGSILLYDPEKDKLVFEYVVGEKADELTGLEIGPDQGIAGLVFQSGASHVSEDVTTEEAHMREVDEKVSYTTQNMVIVLLKSAEGSSIGVLEVLNKAEGPFDQNDVNLIEIMGAQIAAAIETARLHKEARLAEIVKFIGNISHDVKNMITPAQSGAQTLKLIADDAYKKLDETVAQLDCPPQQAVQVTAAMAELREMYPEMVDLMLESTDVVQQRMAEISAAVKGIVAEPHFEEAQVASLAERVVNLLRNQAQSKGVELKLQTEESIPPAKVDKKQIYNAIYNLIYNAIDACNAGDSVTLRIQAQPQGEFPAGGYITIECADTGPGMPEEVREKLFTKDAISTKPMGTGLGTRIVKNVIDAHGGSIEVASEPEIGTTIRAKIPIRRPEET